MGSQLFILLEKLRKLFGIFCTPDDFNIGWPLSTQRSFSEVVKFLLINHVSSICLVLPEIRHVPPVGVGRSSWWLYKMFSIRLTSYGYFLFQHKLTNIYSDPSYLS